MKIMTAELFPTNCGEKLLLMANHVKKWANTVHKRLITHKERFILISISFTKRNNPHHTPSHDMSNICRNNKWVGFIVHYTETGLHCCLFVFWHFFFKLLSTFGVGLEYVILNRSTWLFSFLIVLTFYN